MRRPLAALVLVAALAAGAWLVLSEREGTSRSGGSVERADPTAGPAPVELQPGAAPARGSPPAAGGSAASGSGRAAAAGADRLVVRVQGPGGEPLPVPARVHARGGADLHLQAPADAEGRAVLEGLPTGEIRIDAVARGFTQTNDLLVHLAGDPPADAWVRMEPGGELAGRVLAARTGAPVAGALVDVRGGGTLGNESSVGGRDSYGLVRTDAEGHFETPGLPFDSIVTLVVSARGFRHHEEAHRLLPIEGGRRPLEIRLEAGGLLRGRVTGPDGRPVGRALVRVGREAAGVPAASDANVFLAPGAQRALTTTTDADGRYEVDGLALDEPWCAIAFADGHGAARPRCGLRVTEGRPESEADLVLTRPGRVVLRVRQPSGAPAMGGTVSLGRNEATLATDGTAELTVLVPGEHVLDVQVPAFLRIRERIQVEDGAVVERAYTLDPGVSIAGVVVDDLGRRVADAQVSAFREDVEDGDGGGAASDEQGRFRIDGLARGVYGLEARASGARARPRGGVRAPSTDVEIVVARNGRVRARFTLPAGVAPPPSMQIGNYEPEGEGGGGGREWKGGEVVWDTESGKRVLTVDADGFVPWTRHVEVEPGQSLDLGEIPLDVGVSLAGRVTEAGDRPVPGATVEWPHGDRRAQTGADGSFRLDHLPRGPVRLLAQAAGFVRTPVGVEPGRSSSPVTIVLLRGGRVRGVVLDAAGAPATGVRAHVHDPTHPHADDPGRWEWEEPDAQGRFTARLVPGRYRVDVLRGESVIATTDVTLEEGKETPVEIRLPAGR